MVGIDFDSMTLEQMRDKLLEAKEILRYLNDEYHLDHVHYESIDDGTYKESTYVNYSGFVLKCDFLPYAMGSICLQETCEWIDIFIDVREDNKDEE